MASEEDYSKLSTEDKALHKKWEVRATGYLEMKKFFDLCNDKDPKLRIYSPLMPKILCDSNVNNLDKALEATISFVTNTTISEKMVSDVVSTIIAKCLGSKPKAKLLSSDVMLLYIEKECHEIVQDELIKGVFHKNPKIVVTALKILREALTQFGNKIISIKRMIKDITSLIEARDKDVREESKLLIVEMFRWVGPPLKSHFSSLKPSIVEELDKQFSTVQGSRPKPTRYTRSNQPVEEEIQEEPDNAVEEVSDDEMYCEIDVVTRLPADFFTRATDKNWKERSSALTDLKELLGTTASKLNPTHDYDPLVTCMKKIVTSDKNVMLVMSAAESLKAICNGLKKAFTKYSESCLLAALSRMTEGKQNVVQALRDGSDSFYALVNLENILENIVELLKAKNPKTKIEVSHVLLRYMNKKSTAPLARKNLKIMIDALLTLVSHSSGDVREAGFEIIAAFEKAYGEKNILPYLDGVEELKLNKIKEYFEKSTAKPILKVSAPAETAPKQQKVAPKKTNQKTVPAKKLAPAKKPPNEKKLPEPATPVLAALPLIRNSNERKLPKNLRLLKWNFSAPTPEHVEQLKIVMEYTFSSALMEKMFHQDFKNHISAVETMTKSFDQYNSEILSNVDVILKWVSLRFFDTNPAVHIKILDFLQIIFNCAELTLTDSEISSFLPYLVEKFANSKENVRKMSKTVFGQLMSITGPGKLINYLLEGLKSKLSKLRSECLDLLEGIITSNVLEQREMSSILKQVGATLADKDNAVRNSALNTVVAAYNQIGDSIYGLMGSLPDKSLSFVEERIKRTVRDRTEEEVKPVESKPSPLKLKRQTISPIGSRVTVSPVRSKVASSPVRSKVAISPVRSKVSSSVDAPLRVPPRFWLDLEDFSPTGLVGSKSCTNLLEDNELRSIMNSSVVIPTKSAVNLSQPEPEDHLEIPEIVIERAISQLISHNFELSFAAIIQTAEMLKYEKQLTGHIDRIVIFIIIQLRLIYNRYLNLTDDQSHIDTVDNLKGNLCVLIKIFDNAKFSQQINNQTLSELITLLLLLMIDERLRRVDCHIQLIQSFNHIIHSMIMNCNGNVVFGCIMSLMQDGIAHGNFTEMYLRHLEKCFLLVVTRLGQSEGEFDVAAVVRLVQVFLVACGDHISRDPNHLCLKIVKSFCKIVGASNGMKNFDSSVEGDFGLLEYLRAEVSASKEASPQANILVSFENDRNIVKKRLDEISDALVESCDYHQATRDILQLKSEYGCVDVDGMIHETFHSFILDCLLLCMDVNCEDDNIDAEYYYRHVYFLAKFRKSLGI